MSLENVRENLIQEAKKEERRLLSEAEKEASAIILEAKEQAKRIKNEEKKKASEAVERDSHERISVAKLKANKIVSEARNKLVDDSVNEIWEDFKDSPKKKGYEAFLKKQIKEAEKELGKATIVMVNSTDVKVAEKYSKNVQTQGVNISGGAIVSTKDKSVSIDSSLESIFENNEKEIRGTVFKELFK
ncbi:MAG: V-type ATP synthase subunit E family protein [archaeon]|nr:V-type ATP synthase subunit E family protein [archaeon]